MSEMIEKIARAICRNHDLDPDWGNPPTWKNEWCLADARSALEAIREPTKAMLRKGDAVFDDRSYDRSDELQEAWKAMIDAALPRSP